MRRNTIVGTDDLAGAHSRAGTRPAPTVVGFAMQLNLRTGDLPRAAAKNEALSSLPKLGRQSPGEG